MWTGLDDAGVAWRMRLRNVVQDAFNKQWHEEPNITQKRRKDI